MLEKLMKCSQCLLALLFLIVMPPLILLFSWLHLTGGVHCILNDGCASNGNVDGVGYDYCNG